MDIMLAMVDRPEHKFNVDRADGVSRRDTLAVIAVSVVAAPVVPALTFDERVDALEAIERFYDSQRIGSRKSFEEAVPRTVLENNVRKYLAQSRNLEQLAATPITPEMLRLEASRMRSNSQMPERLSRNLPTRSLTSDQSHRGHSFAGLAPTDDTWDNGILEDPSAPNTPVDRINHTAVWTGNVMIVWGGTWYDHEECGGVLLSSGGVYDLTLDVWHPTSLDDTPERRQGYTAIWTGDEMIVWGGYTGAYLNNGGSYDPVL